MGGHLDQTRQERVERELLIEQHARLDEALKLEFAVGGAWVHAESLMGRGGAIPQGTDGTRLWQGRRLARASRKMNFSAQAR
ncbi:hypothetical protein D3C72_2236700 [compost metagenome]